MDNKILVSSSGFITVAILTFSEWQKLDLSSNPLLGRVLLNNSLKWLKTVLSDEYLLIRREIPSGRFFITLYGWLEFTLMY